MKEKNLEKKVMEIYEKKGTFRMFISDYKKAVAFFKQAQTAYRTGTNRTINGEQETMMAEKYARILESRVYLNCAADFSGMAAMKRLSIYAGLETIILKMDQKVA